MPAVSERCRFVLARVIANPVCFTAEIPVTVALLVALSQSDDRLLGSEGTAKKNKIQGC
jgi:hypothetical protein